MHGTSSHTGGAYSWVGTLNTYEKDVQGSKHRACVYGVVNVLPKQGKHVVESVQTGNRLKKTREKAG